MVSRVGKFVCVFVTGRSRGVSRGGSTRGTGPRGLNRGPIENRARRTACSTAYTR